MRGATILAGSLALAVAGAPAAAGANDDGAYETLPAATFRTSLRYEDAPTSPVATFAMMRTPVTNAQFLAFVEAHPQWRRDRVPRSLADARYLAHWDSANTLADPAQSTQPATQVSWFAASAYCEAEGARLPTWIEWEYAAAADDRRHDARDDPTWRERILAWYARPSSQALPGVGTGTANAFGIHDLHGLVWEWTDDFSSLLVSEDNRNQGDADTARFCGAGALSMDDRENYAVLMRVAMLSSLQASGTTRNLGFRCARSSR